MAAPTSDAIQQLRNDTKQLTTKGREAAFSLFTLAHAISTTKIPPKDIANKLFAIVGLLPGLTEVLAIPLPHDSLLFSASRVEELSKLLNACTEVARGVEDVVAAVSEAVWSADTISSEPDSAFEKFGTFVSGSFVQETLELCFHDVVAAVADAREKDLLSRCYNSDSQYFETIRLQESLKHTKFQTSSGFRANTSEMASVQLPIRTEKKESQQPPDSPSEQQNDSKKLPMSVASFNSWPPYQVSFANQAEYDAQVKLGHEIIDKYNTDLDAEPAASSSGVPINTPETTRASTPEAGATENALRSTTAEKETAKHSKTEDSKDNNRKGTSVEDAAQEILSKGKERQTEPKVKTSPTKAADAQSQPTFSFGSAKPIGPVYTPYEKSTYREAYILRPLCDEFRGVIEWTYKVEQLRIDAEQVDAHVKKLGPDYSVLDSIGELHPEQMRLVQLRAKQRHGQLVSVQLAPAVDMATTMGILQVKPVIFVVKSIWPPEPEKTESQKPLFPSSGGGGLFGGGTATGFGFGGFGQPPKAPESTSLWGGWGGKPRDAKSYTQTLQEQGEVCTYVEDADKYGGDRLAHYQTITPTMKKDVSFEELRLHDVAAGRTGPMKHNGFTYPWDASSSNGTEGLFGKSSSSATTSGSGQPGSTTTSNTAGLFGAPPHSLEIPNSSTNHFSAPPVTSSGNLFGAPPSPTENTRSLFGAPLHSTDNHTICTCNIPHAPGPCTELVKSKSTNPFGAPSPLEDNDLVCMCGVHHWRPGTCPRPVKRTSFGLFNQASAPTTSSNLFSAPSANSTATQDTTREIPQADRSKVVQCCMPVIPGQPSGPGLFNQPPKTGLFGNGTGQQPRPAGGFGLFGGGFGSNNTTSTQSNPRPTGGIFGGSFGIDNKLSTQPNPPTQGGFGCGFRIKNNTNTQSSPPPPGGLFGQPTTPAPPPTQGIFGQPTPQLLPRGLFGTSTSTTGPLTPNQKLSCKSCFTSLVFHPEPEQKAGICDVCAKKKDTGCWLCVRQLRVVTPTNKIRNINEEEGSATGGLKKWGPEQIAAGFGATEKREVKEGEESPLFGSQSQKPNPFNPRSGSVLTTPHAEPGKKDDTKNTQIVTKEATYSSTSAGGGAGVVDE